MGDENTILTEADARHVLRRSGFAATRKELDRAKLVGLTRSQAADELLDFKPKRLKPGGSSYEAAHAKWLKTVLRFRSPLQAKLVFFLHDHFSTSFSAVQNVKLMGQQIQLLHTQAKGNFKDLVKAIGLDPAMMEMLDTVRNRKFIPNENYGRELCELFTLGVFDLAGNPNYAQEDIVQIARAFTGWLHYSNGKKVRLEGFFHDTTAEYPERGPKVLFDGVHGFPAGGASFTVGGEGENEIDEVVEILFQHTDTDGENTVARRTAQRLIEFFAHGAYANPGAPEIAVIDQIVADSGFDSNWEIASLCRAIFVHDVFFETSQPAPFGASTRKSVKWPVDFMISTMRLLGMKGKSRFQFLPGGSYFPIGTHLTNMGQRLMDPPSVFGWNWETAWLSSSTLLARYNFARDIAASRGSGRFRPEKLMSLDLTDPGEIVDAVTEVLDVGHQISIAERQVFIDYLTDNGANPVLDLNDYDIRNNKLHGLFALVIQSPAYQVH